LIYPTGSIREISGVTQIYYEIILNSKKDKTYNIVDNSHIDVKEHGCLIRLEEIVYDEFIKVQRIHVNSEDYMINNVIPNFNRQVNDQDQIKIPINLSLPLEEIISYITKVKEKIDIKSPIELLGEELDQANDLTNMMIISKKKKKIHLNVTKGNYPQYALADMIYIYDMTNKGYPQQDILYSISEYYEILNDDKGLALKLTLRDERTITKYFEIAKDYIENARYKELITGKASLK